MQYQMNEFLFAMILTELEDAVGKENCSTRAIDRVTHSVDYYWLSRMWADRGCRMPEADIIVCPKDAEEVSKVVKIANYYKLPVTTWGAGGGTQGGAIPVCGGILLDTKRMNKIYEVNTEGMYIECGTGAIYKHIEWAANEVGKATMHYPSSLTCSTVGGFLAHRGIGVCSTKYGKIDDMVLQMEVVLPNGDIINTSSAPKHAAGPDLNQIFIGSEGTLGIITKAQIRIFDQPEERRFRGFLCKHNRVPARNANVYAAAAGAALVNIIHYFRKLDSITVYKRNTERAGAGGASFMTRCVAYRTDMVAHPAKAAGINMLFSFIR